MEAKSRGVLAPGNVAQLFSMNKNVRIYLSITLTGRLFCGASGGAPYQAHRP
jgi:hypothetical protein